MGTGRQDTEVTVVKVNNEDYFCLTDMIKAKDGDFFITDWLRNRNTLEYLGIWERVYNPRFNYGEFALIKSRSGLNSFKISVKEFVARTNAVGLQAKAGRYGGTYAHKDIAFEFAMWISMETIRCWLTTADDPSSTTVPHKPCTSPAQDLHKTYTRLTQELHKSYTRGRQ